MMWRRTFTAVTKPVIVKMGTDDQGNSDQQKKDLELNKKLF